MLNFSRDDYKLHVISQNTYFDYYNVSMYILIKHEPLVILFLF